MILDNTQSTHVGTPLPGLDEAWSRATPKEIVGGGFKFVARYFSYDRTGKNLTPDEARILAAAGLWIVTVWEFTPGAPLNGRTQGSLDALAALKQARACGQPPGSTVYFACDENFPVAQWSAISDYFKGAASTVESAGYNIGAYCDYSLGKWLLDLKYIDMLWQTYAWSDGIWDPRAVIRQTRNGINVGGANVDADTAEYFEYGQWQPGRLPSETETPTMDMTTPIPGTATPDHPTPRNGNDLGGDWAQLRNMLVIGDVHPPAGSPLARILAVPDQVATILSAVQSIAASVSNLTAGVQALHNSQITDGAVRDIAAAIDGVAVSLAGKTPLAALETAPAGVDHTVSP